MEYIVYVIDGKKLVEFYFLGYGVAMNYAIEISDEHDEVIMVTEDTGQINYHFKKEGDE